jgi:hypothetical protein
MFAGIDELKEFGFVRKSADFRGIGLYGVA